MEKWKQTEFPIIKESVSTRWNVLKPLSLYKENIPKNIKTYLCSNVNP